MHGKDQSQAESHSLRLQKQNEVQSQNHNLEYCTVRISSLDLSSSSTRTSNVTYTWYLHRPIYKIDLAISFHETNALPFPWSRLAYKSSQLLFEVGQIRNDDCGRKTLKNVSYTRRKNDQWDDEAFQLKGSYEETARQCALPAWFTSIDALWDGTKKSASIDQKLQTRDRWHELRALEERSKPLSLVAACSAAGKHRRDISNSSDTENPVFPRATVSLPIFRKAFV